MTTSSNTTEAQTQDPKEFWGTLITSDRGATDLFNALLGGIVNYMGMNVEPKEVKYLVPDKIAGFYKSVGADYDGLFRQTPFVTLSYIYQALGCVHSLRQPISDNFAPPTIPALAPAGFVRWQTIQLLLDPNEQVPFLQEAVRKFDIINPATGQPFPKVLPREAFPDKPDEKMTEWHKTVYEKLQREAEKEQASAAQESPASPTIREHTRSGASTSSRRSHTHSSAADSPVSPAAMPAERDYIRTPYSHFRRDPSNQDDIVYVTPPQSPYMNFNSHRSRRRSYPEEIYHATDYPARPPQRERSGLRPNQPPRRKSHSPVRRDSISSPSSSSSGEESDTESETPDSPRVRKKNQQLSPTPHQTHFVSPSPPPHGLGRRHSRDFAPPLRQGSYERADRGGREYIYHRSAHAPHSRERDRERDRDSYFAPPRLAERASFRGLGERVKWGDDRDAYLFVPAAVERRRASPERVIYTRPALGRRVTPPSGVGGRRYPGYY